MICIFFGKGMQLRKKQNVEGRNGKMGAQSEFLQAYDIKKGAF